MTTKVAPRKPNPRAPASRYQMYISGTFVPAKSGKTFDVFEPTSISMRSRSDGIESEK